MDAAQRWTDELAAWRIDPEILEPAPESPYRLDPEWFRAEERDAGDSPSRRRAVQALPAGGSVLDVGCGGGAAAFALVPPAALVVGVDESEGMLAEFTRGAARHGVDARTVQGRWPDVATQAPPADVVVCHHVAYNVADLPAFARALDAHARHRVVMELTAVHPWVPIGPLWRRFHGQDRPTGPSADLAADVLREAGLPVRVERFDLPGRPYRDRAAQVAATRRRLCLTPDRDDEVDRAIGAETEPPARAVVTLWWDVQSGP